MLCACLHEPMDRTGATKTLYLFHFGCITTVILLSEDMDYKQPLDAGTGIEPAIFRL